MHVPTNPGCNHTKPVAEVAHIPTGARPETILHERRGMKAIDLCAWGNDAASEVTSILCYMEHSNLSLKIQHSNQTLATCV